MTFAEAMRRFGTDKPDTRFGLEIEENNEEFFITSPIVLDDLQGFVCPKEIHFDRQRTFSMKKTNDGDVEQSLTQLGKFRLIFADYLEKTHRLELRKKRQWNFLWITDFPLFTPTNAERTQFESTHHPFTAPIDEHLSWINSPQQWAQMTGQHYDLVLNGFEVAGGSIRIFDSFLQRFVLHDILRLPIEHLEHLLKALGYGAPPHGGIALGLDRLLALLLETEHIRDVIAFPKTSNGKDLMAQAPSAVEQSELDYYFLKIEGKHRSSSS